MLEIAKKEAGEDVDEGLHVEKQSSCMFGGMSA